MRYSLVDAPEEDATSQRYWTTKNLNHLAAVNAKDHRMITTLLVRRLASPGNGVAPLSAFYAQHLLPQFFESIQKRKAYDLCVPEIESGFEHLWREIPRPETKDQKWWNLMAYGFIFLGMVR